MLGQDARRRAPRGAGGEAHVSSARSARVGGARSDAAAHGRVGSRASGSSAVTVEKSAARARLWRIAAHQEQQRGARLLIAAANERGGRESWNAGVAARHDGATSALRGCGHSMGVENACERTSSVASVTARFWLACAEHRAHWVKGGCGAAVRAESGSGSGALSAIPLPSASHNQFSRHVYEIHSQTLMEISD